ncbi:cupin domain-containing protein [Streptomyces chiangmaiensis]|uniref:Cupin 2 conserved barrel domain-containing protein n=1 Tax=Streptomyces chiangmaiensis TaxID=766497 RepID=A0ABU7FRU7_9ACTN|nr:hypothetical protein [Streptomyces chiangmaiensis]MED7826203.1 hypothetical protein [Streptomyces chiangmaiensis]
MVKGEMIFELEGEPERVLKAGESFYEPSHDVIHYQGANNLSDGETIYMATILGVPVQPVVIPVSAEELEARKDRRAPRPQQFGWGCQPRAGLPNWLSAHPAGKFERGVAVWRPCRPYLRATATG